MTSEQLLATRATLWRQRAEPLLTLDDAQAWLLQSGLSLFLPRKAQIRAPAPSFVEACLGETSAMPPRSAIDTAKGLLVRLIEAGSALPLNLLGAPLDYPDFLVSEEAFPFIYALRGDRDWKHAPGSAGANRVSPLITHIWQLLERRGVLTATEIQEELGKELTEAAVLRALNDLWGSLRVIPLYQAGGQETLWEPLQSRHQKAMTSGVGMSQVTALSVLASVYLQSVVAASGDDAESFLSPLASRSKVREVIRGLTATRQLAMIQMETHSLLYVEGSLPEFPEEEKLAVEAAEATAKPVRRPHPTSPEGMQAALKRSITKSAAGSAPRPAYKRPATSTGEPGTGRPPARSAGRPLRPAAGDRPDSRKREGGASRPAASSGRPAFKSGSKPAFKATLKPSFKSTPSPIERSEPGTGLRADGSPKKTRWRDMPGGRPDQKGKPARFGPRKTEGEDGAASAPRREAGRSRPAAGARPAFRPGSSPRAGKPFRPTSSGRPSYGGTGSRGTDAPRSGAGPSRPFNTGRPPIRSSDGRSGSRPPARSGAGRFVARPEGSRPFSRPRREDGDAPTRTPRDGSSGTGDRKFTPRTPRAGGFSSSRQAAGGARPYTPRIGGPSSAGRPSTGRSASGRPPSPGSSYGRSSSSGRPASGGRPSSGRPAGGKSFSGSSFGKKPGFGANPGFGSKPAGSSFKPGGPRAGSGSRPTSRPPSRPGYGQGPRPGAGRSGPGAGGPRSGTGAKPGGRPPAKFKKRPE